MLLVTIVLITILVSYLGIIYLSNNSNNVEQEPTNIKSNKRDLSQYNTEKTYTFDDIDFTKVNFTDWEYFNGNIYNVFYNPMYCSFYRTISSESYGCLPRPLSYIPVEYYPYKTIEDPLWKWYLLKNNKICPDNYIGVTNPIDGKLDCYPMKDIPLKESGK